MFEKAIKLFDDYQNSKHNYDIEKYGEKLIAIDAETCLKLSQIQWLISRIQDLHKYIAKQHDVAVHHSCFPLIFEMQILTESFYHFAFRLYDLLNDHHPILKRKKRQKNNKSRRD